MLEKISHLKKKTYVMGHNMIWGSVRVRCRIVTGVFALLVCFPVAGV